MSLNRGQLAQAAGISKGTIDSIETGQGFTGDYILSISHFFGMELSELVNYHLPIPDELEFRKKLKKYHRNNSTAYKILDSAPNLNSLIEFRLAQTDFLRREPRSVKEISGFCKSEYQLTIKSPALSQALRKAVDNRVLRRIRKGGRNYLYQA